MVVQAGQQVPQGKWAAPRLVSHACRDRRLGRRRRKLVVADDADDLFDEILFDAQIEAPARRRHRDGASALAELQAQAPENFAALRLRQRHADELGRARHAQRHWLRLGQGQYLVIQRAR